MNTNRLAALAAAAAFTATPALAHEAAGHTHSLLQGVMHPLSGADHVLAMVTVGVFAAMLGGRAVWALPAGFLSGMLAGGLLGFAGVALPHVELGIALSVIVLGALAALGAALPVALGAALAAVFAVFHGFAHGAELPAGAGAAAYAAGFLAATAALHGAGLLVGRLGRAARLAGAAAALAGLALLAG